MADSKAVFENGNAYKGNFKDDGKRIDFVLFYKNPNFEDIGNEDISTAIEQREAFESTLKKNGLEIEHEIIEDNVYVKIHCTFDRLCIEAEKVKLEMPLAGLSIPQSEKQSWWKRCKTCLKTDDEVDFISAPFQIHKSFLFKGISEKSTFFRPALRNLLVEHILINLDIRKSEKIEGTEDTVNKQGLTYLLMKGSYADAFVLHDESKIDPFRSKKEAFELSSDPRRILNETWLSCFQFQPLWKIRNYFGEKIALYFAWQGLLITSLWFPAVCGVGFFIYGLLLSPDKLIIHNDGEGLTDNLSRLKKDVLSTIRNAMDNSVTPFYAIIISLWGTTFVELWKRKNSRLAYKWDVDNFEETEPDRPQFYGTKLAPDPISNEKTWYYPFSRRIGKYFTSMSILLLMICLVCGSVIGVIVFRVTASVSWSHNDTERFLYTSVLAAFLNFLSILILGQIYERIAKLLTDWENHRTQSEYNDALIIKLFAFQFVNSYASLFYIAFFRANVGKSGIFGLGEDYVESCGLSGCMATLSFQVLVMMALKPIFRNSFSTLLQYIKLNIRMGYFFSSNKIGNFNKGSPDELDSYIARERIKQDLGDFTLGEYSEKIIQYGYVMLFAASFPLAPFLALLTNAFDMRMDACRLLWWSRRPVGHIAQDMGMWLTILQFVNIAGIITNAFLLAFTSSFGRGGDGSRDRQLWTVIIYEHVVIFIVIFIVFLIPDIPSDIRLAMRRERFQVAQILEEGLLSIKEGAYVGPETPTKNVDDNNVKFQKDEVTNSDHGGVYLGPESPFKKGSEGDQTHVAFGP